MVPFFSALRPLGIRLETLRRQGSRAMTWLPWLGLALLVAAVLSPGTVNASHMAFQSPPATAPTPLPPTPTPLPPPPAATPVPAEPATDTPVPAPAEEVAPTEAVPTEALPVEETSPVEGPPAAEESLPPVEATEPPAALPEAAPPLSSEEPTTEQPPDTQPGQPIINWVKFWDTLAVTLAYPWLCCGIGILLLVPLGLLYLEIKGRRRPPRPPEPLTTEKKGYEE